MRQIIAFNRIPALSKTFCTLLVSATAFSCMGTVRAADALITNGTQFKDTTGNVIHAHGGGVIKSGSCYYWYGEHRDSGNFFLGVSCYKSTDLKNWECRGDVLTKNSAAELNSCYVERPKVLYNASTGQYVMWMHWENGVDYRQARCAVAYGSSPDSSFTYQASFRPCQNDGLTDHGSPGYMSRDCTVFVDSDGTGYFLSASNDNMDLHLYELTPDYRSISALVTKLFAGQQREAPCLFKRDNYYFLVTSGCSGWYPNQGKYAYSTRLTNGWSGLRNLGDSSTYRSQPAYILPIQGSAGTAYLYMGDRWAGAWSGPVMDSQYVWLPLLFNSKVSLWLPYGDIATLDAAAGTIELPRYYRVVNQHSNKVLDVSGGSVEDGGKVLQWPDTGGINQHWRIADADGYKKLINRNSGKVMEACMSSAAGAANIDQWTDTGGKHQQWTIKHEGNGWNKIINRNSGKLLEADLQPTSDGAQVDQSTDNQGANQRWKFVQVP
jgi:hypothetical protein